MRRAPLNDIYNYCVTECGTVADYWCGEDEYCRYYRWEKPPLAFVVMAGPPVRDNSDCDGDALCNQGMCFNLNWCATV